MFRSSVVMESGFQVAFKWNMPIQNFLSFKLAERGGKNGFSNYISLKEFIQDHSMIGPLLYAKLDYLFRLYFVFTLLVLLTCFIRIKKRTICQFVRRVSSHLSHLPKFVWNPLRRRILAARGPLFVNSRRGARGMKSGIQPNSSMLVPNPFRVFRNSYQFPR